MRVRYSYSETNTRDCITATIITALLCVALPRSVILTVLYTHGLETVKPVLNRANVCSPEHTSDTSTNYDSFLNLTFSSPNMVRTVQTLLRQLACNEMQASARTCGRRAADSMIENVG